MSWWSVRIRERRRLPALAISQKARRNDGFSAQHSICLKPMDITSPACQNGEGVADAMNSMRHRLFAFAFTAPAIVLSLAGPAVGYTYRSDEGPKPPAECHPPPISTANRYPQIHRILLRSGYSPVRSRDSDCGPNGFKYLAASCKLFPELEACAVDTGECSLLFQDKAGHKLQIVTIGDSPVAEQAMERWNLDCDLAPAVKKSPTVKPVPDSRLRRNIDGAPPGVK